MPCCDHPDGESACLNHRPRWRAASVSDRELTAVQEGREILGRYSLADLILLADTLGIEPFDLRIIGTVVAGLSEADR